MRFRFDLTRWMVILAIVAGTGLVQADEAQTLPAGYTRHIQPLLVTYCTGCHGMDEPEAGARLEFEADEIDLTNQNGLWRNVLAKVKTSEMPPADELQPSAEERMQLVAWLTEAVSRVDCSQLSQPGRVTLHRLNRTEYNNTIRDLTGLDFQPAESFPADDVGNGFDNIADLLSLPPLLMEKYLEAAEDIVTRIYKSEEARQQVLELSVTPERDADACAEATLKTFASRAFRRPVLQDELNRLITLYRAERDAGVGYPESLSLPLTAILASPHFLFRVELDQEPDGNNVRQLNDFELASRMSYFLWSSMPDRPLFQVALQDRLQEEQTLAAEIDRMLTDEKSSALIDNFFGQWLQLRMLNKIAPDPEKFPSFDDELRVAMQMETRKFAEAVVREDRSILDFLDADYTFVNERLAKHYGIESVKGSEFREVKLTDPRRGGVLTQASILTLTSNPTRTSPVKRGKWIMENILGTPPPPPPPGVQELEEDGGTELLGSLRERMEQHRSDPSCAVCHTKMDALGFGFENFDAVGSWREKDGRFQIDPSGSLPGGLAFQGPAELRRILKDDRRDEFVRCITEKMLTYALGRELQSYDLCAVDDIMQEVAENDYRFSGLVLAIVQSEPFRSRGFRGESK